MPSHDPVRKERNERSRQKRAAFRQLKAYAKSKIELQRPVFFVPGWRDEAGHNWTEPYRRATPLKTWFKSIIKNQQMVHYITFSAAESKRCESFIDFGRILKDKIEAKVDKREKFDLVGHSMGGLDIRAAVVLHGLKNVHNCITAATPHQGSQLGEIGAKVIKAAHHRIQSKNLDPDHEPIKIINTLAHREKFLKGVSKLYQFYGTRDMVVMRSARMNRRGLDKALRQKMHELAISGASHHNHKAITRDVRLVSAVTNILAGIELKKPKLNYGFIYRKKKS